MPDPAPALRVVKTTKPKARTRAQLSRALATALAREDCLARQLVEAKAQTDTAFTEWAAGRCISRETARRQLESTGLLPERKL